MASRAARLTVCRECGALHGRVWLFTALVDPPVGHDWIVARWCAVDAQVVSMAGACVMDCAIV